MQLFKRFLLAFTLIFVFCTAQASVSILNPVRKTVEPNQTIELGSAMPGETMLVTIDRNAAFHSWSDAWIDAELLPRNWKMPAFLKEEKSLSLKVNIPPSARLGSQNLPITVADERTGIEEKFNAVIFIEKSLVSVAIPETQKGIRVNSTACYKITLFNDSLALHSILVSSSLPKYWFSGIEAEIGPKASIDLNACVNAMVIGSRDFYFYVDSMLFNERFHSIRASIDVLPTARGKYSAPLSGFPFFMPTLVPYYLIDSFLSLLS